MLCICSCDDREEKFIGKIPLVKSIAQNSLKETEKSSTLSNIVFLRSGWADMAVDTNAEYWSICGILLYTVLPKNSNSIDFTIVFFERVVCIVMSRNTLIVVWTVLDRVHWI